MQTKRTFEKKVVNGRIYHILGLPNTNYFELNVTNLNGSHIERVYAEKTGKNVYGISHFIEHLGFKSPKDYTTQELIRLIRNEGTHNASTNHDRIDYYFQTTMDRLDLAINLVLNYALNDLSRITPEEFQTERKVVYNESKRYLDDDQRMFYFNTTPALCGYDKEDNVIGIPQTIDTFTIEDCIAIKDMFMQSSDYVYKITYDPMVMHPDEIITKVEKELTRFTPLNRTHLVAKSEYLSSIKTPNTGHVRIDNPSEQAMTAINLDTVENYITAQSGNEFWHSYAQDVSLKDLIRDQNGLTYAIYLFENIVGYKPYTIFVCDVTRGTEGRLMELIQESINKTADLWDAKAHEKYIRAKKLKRSMTYLDQKKYSNIHSMALWHPQVFDSVRELMSQDVDHALEVLDELHATPPKVGDYLQKTKEYVNTKNYGLVTN